MPQIICSFLMLFATHLASADVPRGCAECLDQCPHETRELRECDRGCPSSCSKAQVAEYKKKKQSALENDAHSASQGPRCLTADDKKELEELEDSYAKAIEAKPGCKKMYGAAGCLDPLSLNTLKILRDKKELQNLNDKLTAEKLENPGCERRKGAASCLMPMEIMERDELLKKYPECDDGQKSIHLEIPSTGR